VCAPHVRGGDQQTIQAVQRACRAVKCAVVRCSVRGERARNSVSGQCGLGKAQWGRSGGVWEGGGGGGGPPVSQGGAQGLVKVGVCVCVNWWGPNLGG